MPPLKQGYAKAQNHAGIRLVRGDGIAADPVRGLMFLMLAARQGHGAASKNVDAVTPDLSDDEGRQGEEHGRRIPADRRRRLSANPPEN